MTLDQIIEAIGIEPYHREPAGVIYCADCLDVLPKIPEKSIDLVLTDPPYGIDWAGSNASTRKWESLTNDNGRLDIRPILNMTCDVVSFGANCYPEQLPHRGRWICWDKRVDPKADAMLGSPFELAWTNKTSGFDKIYRIMHGGVVNSDGGKRVHPTQKPIKLFEMILNDYPRSNIIFDPFLGSGTTAVAAKQLGRKYIGIEISSDYCQIGVQRLAQEELF